MMYLAQPEICEHIAPPFQRLIFMCSSDKKLFLITVGCFLIILYFCHSLEIFRSCLTAYSMSMALSFNALRNLQASAGVRNEGATYRPTVNDAFRSSLKSTTPAVLSNIDHRHITVFLFLPHTAKHSKRSFWMQPVCSAASVTALFHQQHCEDTSTPLASLLSHLFLSVFLLK